MPKHRVFFHPFPQANCRTVVNSDKVKPTDFDFDPTLSWHHARADNIFYADDPEETLERGWRILKQDLVNSVIYVIGQCGAGLQEYYSLDTKEKLDCSGLLTCLESIVYDSTFKGTIKLYACKSGLGGEKGSTSFALSFAALAKTNWAGAKLVSYTEAIGIVAIRDDDRKTGKFVIGSDPEAKKDQHRWTPGTDKRAKECQIITTL